MRRKTDCNKINILSQNIPILSQNIPILSQNIPISPNKEINGSINEKINKCLQCNKIYKQKVQTIKIKLA